MGWVLIAVHFSGFIFNPTSAFWGALVGDIGFASLSAAGVLFMWASVPYRSERSSQLMLVSLLSTNTLYVILSGFEHPWPWALNGAAVLFGGAPLAIALGARRSFTHVLRWLLVGLYCMLSVFLLAFQNRPGNGPTLALNAVFFTVYFGCCIHVWYSYRGRGTAGSLICNEGFLGWAGVFVLGPLVKAFVPNRLFVFVVC